MDITDNLLDSPSLAVSKLCMMHKQLALFLIIFFTRHVVRVQTKNKALKCSNAIEIMEEVDHIMSETVIVCLQEIAAL